MQLELKSVSYTYAPDTPYSADAVKNVSLKIEKGEFIGIIGRTGSGKSTLIQLMDGLISPSQGAVLLDREDINGRNYNKNTLRKKAGIVFQFPDYQLFESTVERDIAFGLKHSGLSKAEKEARVQEALSAVGFDYEEVRKKSPLGFSGGEKRRLAIAGALASKPEILIFDEPIAGLDPLGRQDFARLAEQLCKNGTTIIIVSHNTDFLAECAKRIILMENGTVKADGRAEDILSDTQLMKTGGISAGAVFGISQMLRENGVKIGSGIIRYNQLMEELCRIYGRDKK